MAKATHEAKVEGLGDIYEVSAPFDESMKALRVQGIRQPITSRDLAYARREAGKRSSLCSYGSYTREGFEYAKDQPVLLKLKSRILTNQGIMKQAVEVNRNCNYFAMGKEIYEQDSEQAQKDTQDTR